MRKRTLVALLAAGAMLAVTAVGAAQNGFSASLFGGAVAEKGDVKLVSDLSDASTANDFSGIRISVPAGTTFADLKTLSTEFNVTDDDCGGGSPRFELDLGSQNVFVYLGPSPSFTGCAKNTWLSSGNLIGNNDACRWDTSQVSSGTQCNTYTGTLALIGTRAITQIRLVVDSGWFFADKEQTVLVRNVRVNGQTFFSPNQGQAKSPAQICKAQRAALGDAAFAQRWGTNHNKRNAFGKCVSAMTKAATQSASNSSTGHHGKGKGKAKGNGKGR
jgi:hypothetical protein